MWNSDSICSVLYFFRIYFIYTCSSYITRSKKSSLEIENSMVELRNTRSFMIGSKWFSIKLFQSQSFRNYNLLIFICFIQNSENNTHYLILAC